MDPDPSPDPAPAADEASTTLAALSLRAAADLPPDFAAPEIDEDDDDDEGYATAASRGGSSTAAWKEEMEGLEEDAYGDAGPPSPSSSGYAGERGSSLASSGAGGIEEEDAATPPHAPGAEDWARGKKHADEVLAIKFAPSFVMLLLQPHHCFLSCACFVCLSTE
jgi:hypothetical protein